MARRRWCNPGWLCVATCALLGEARVNVAAAQRFEGIITMRLSGGQSVGRSGGGGRAGEGRGRAAGAPSEGRGGARGAGRGARSGEAGLPDPREEAMRDAFASGLQNIEYMTRRGKVRIGLPGAAGKPSPAAMIYVPDEGVMYTVLPAASMYSETAIADLSRAAGEGGAGNTATRAPTVTHTKQFELVAGHKCEHVVISYATEKTDICMGKGLGVFIMPASMGRAGVWERVMGEANGFPLRVQQGNGTVVMEVTKIERKALPEALFSVPDSYTRMPDVLRRPPG